MIFNKQEVKESNVGSYLFEIFKLEPNFSDYFSSEEDKSVSMTDFINSHNPRSVYLENLENILFPYLKAKKSLAKNIMEYRNLTEELEKTNDIDNLKPDEKAELNATQKKLPGIAAKIKEHEKQIAQMEESINKKLAEIKKSCESHTSKFKQKQIETIHNILDTLDVPREQFKEKDIDNPLNFTSYSEAMDYISRQTTVKLDQIPIKNIEKAKNDDKVFQQLLLYLALVDCLLPLGIVYGK